MSGVPRQLAAYNISPTSSAFSNDLQLDRDAPQKDQPSDAEDENVQLDEDGHDSEEEQASASSHSDKEDAAHSNGDAVKDSRTTVATPSPPVARAKGTKRKAGPASSTAPPLKRPTPRVVSSVVKVPKSTVIGLQRRLTSMGNNRRRLQDRIRQMERELLELADNHAKFMDRLHHENRTLAATNSASLSPPTAVSSSSGGSAAGNRMRDLRKTVKHLIWRPSADAEAERIDTFLDSYQLRLTNDGATPDELLQLIGPCLGGTAFQWYLMLKNNGQLPETWEEFKLLAKAEYQPKLSFAAADQQLRSCMKTPQESYNHHLVRFNRCLQDVPVGSVSPQSTLAIYMGCLDPTIAYELELKLNRESFDPLLNVSSPIPSLTQMSSWAETLERARKELVRRSTSTFSGRQSIFTASSAVVVAQHAATPPVPAAHLPIKTSDSTSTPGVSPNYRGKNPIAGFQYRKRDPTQDSQANTPPGRNAAVQSSPPLGRSSHQGKPSRDGVVCYGCGQTGHIRRQCPTNPPKVKAEPSSDGQPAPKP